MKKLILALFAIGAVATAQAQKAGSLLIYGSAGYGSENVTNNAGLPGATDVEERSNTWNFSPGIGYQFNNNWTVGINFSIGGNKYSEDIPGGTEEVRVTEMAVGPFIRHTHSFNKTFFLFNQLNLSYLNDKVIFDDGVAGTPDLETVSNGFGVNWFPGVGINFRDNVALNFAFGGLGYGTTTADLPGPGETTNSGFNFNFGQTFNIGISANIGVRRTARGNMEPGMENRRLRNYEDDEDDE